MVSGVFLAVQLVWTTTSCAPGLVSAWPRVSFHQGTVGDKTHLGRAVQVTRTVIGRSTLEPCLICGEADPMISYTYGNRKVVRLHAACDAFWQLELEAR